MTRRIVEHEEALSRPICLLLEDVNRIVDLLMEFLGTKVPLAVFAHFEQDPCLTG